jgi:hypothetical protein
MILLYYYCILRQSLDSKIRFEDFSLFPLAKLAKLDIKETASVCAPLVRTRKEKKLWYIHTSKGLVLLVVCKCSVQGVCYYTLIEHIFKPVGHSVVYKGRVFNLCVTPSPSSMPFSPVDMRATLAPPLGPHSPPSAAFPPVSGSNTHRPRRRAYLKSRALGLLFPPRRDLIKPKNHSRKSWLNWYVSIVLYNFSN